MAHCPHVCATCWFFTLWGIAFLAFRILIPFVVLNVITRVLRTEKQASELTYACFYFAIICEFLQLFSFSKCVLKAKESGTREFFFAEKLSKNLPALFDKIMVKYNLQAELKKYLELRDTLKYLRSLAYLKFTSRCAYLLIIRVMFFKSNSVRIVQS